MTALRPLLQRHLWLAPLLVLVLMAAVIGILRPSTFAQDQIEVKIAAALTLILIGTGQTIVVLRGGIDLSVGAILALATAVAATRGEPELAASAVWIAGILALGAGIGAVSGLLIAVMQLQPFVVTLAVWSVVEGVALLILPSESSGVPAAWVEAAYGHYLGLSLPVILMILLALGWAWFLRTRWFGALRAAGSHERSAFLNGVSPTRTSVAAYALSGFFAAAAGVYFAAQTGSGSPTLGGQYILPSIAAVVIGGTRLSGGRATLIGTITGAFVLTLIGDVVFLLKLQSYWQPVMSGLILMLVVIVSGLSEAGPESEGQP